MKSKTTVRVEAIGHISKKKLGLFDAERFIDIIKKDNFNYTEWRKTLWEDKTLTEIYEDAVETCNELKEVINLFL